MRFLHALSGVAERFRCANIGISGDPEGRRVTTMLTVSIFIFVFAARYVGPRRFIANPKSFLPLPRGAQDVARCCMKPQFHIRVLGAVHGVISHTAATNRFVKLRGLGNQPFVFLNMEV